MRSRSNPSRRRIRSERSPLAERLVNRAEKLRRRRRRIAGTSRRRDDGEETARVLREPRGMERALALRQVGVREREQLTEIRIPFAALDEERDHGKIRRGLRPDPLRLPGTRVARIRVDAELGAHDDALAAFLRREVRARRTVESVAIAQRESQRARALSHARRALRVAKRRAGTRTRSAPGARRTGPNTERILSYRVPLKCSK